jgi:hypothetical protein
MWPFVKSTKSASSASADRKSTATNTENYVVRVKFGPKDILRLGGEFQYFDGKTKRLVSHPDQLSAMFTEELARRFVQIMLQKTDEGIGVPEAITLERAIREHR